MPKSFLVKKKKQVELERKANSAEFGPPSLSNPDELEPAESLTEPSPSNARSLITAVSSTSCNYPSITHLLIKQEDEEEDERLNVKFNSLDEFGIQETRYESRIKESLIHTANPSTVIKSSHVIATSASYGLKEENPYAEESALQGYSLGVNSVDPHDVQCCDLRTDVNSFSIIGAQNETFHFPTAECLTTGTEERQSAASSYTEVSDDFHLIDFIQFEESCVSGPGSPCNSPGSSSMTDSSNSEASGSHNVLTPLGTTGKRSGSQDATDNKKYRYVCDVCGKAFIRSNTLTTHKRIHTGDKPFKCEQCGRAFRQPGNLTRHRLTHTTVKPYVCPQCNKAFNRASNLHTHMRTHTNYKPFVCDFCGKGFHQKIDMKIHRYTHTGEKPHKCQKCGRGFKQLTHLTYHMRTHSDVRMYECEYCGKGFNQKGNLQAHIYGHTGQRPYKCEICGKGFTLASTLNTHKRTHAPKKPFQCQLCDKAFYQKNALKTHYIASHPFANGVSLL